MWLENRGSQAVSLQIRYSVALFVSGKGHWTKPRVDRKRDPATASIDLWRLARYYP